MINMNFFKKIIVVKTFKKKGPKTLFDKFYFLNHFFMWFLVVPLVWVCSINKQKMNILHATFLTKYLQRIDGNLCFTLVLIQIIIDVVMSNCKHMYTMNIVIHLLRKFFNLSLRTKMQDEM